MDPCWWSAAVFEKDSNIIEEKTIQCNYYCSRNYKKNSKICVLFILHKLASVQKFKRIETAGEFIDTCRSGAKFLKAGQKFFLKATILGILIIHLDKIMFGRSETIFIKYFRFTLIICNVPKVTLGRVVSESIENSRITVPLNMC